MPLYRFYSRETGDIIMMQPQAKKILDLLEKDPAGPGILLHTELLNAVEVLREAVREQEARKLAEAEAVEKDKDAPKNSGASESVSLRQRTAPLIDMLLRCAQAEVDVVWDIR